MTDRRRVNPVVDASVRVIPAAAGFFVISPLGNDAGSPVGVFKAPVLAWALEGSSLFPHPVTLDGIEQDDVWIMRPDGIVERPYMNCFLTIEEWLAAQQDEFMRASKD